MCEDGEAPCAWAAEGVFECATCASLTKFEQRFDSKSRFDQRQNAVNGAALHLLLIICTDIWTASGVCWGARRSSCHS